MDDYADAIAAMHVTNYEQHGTPLPAAWGGDSE